MNNDRLLWLIIRSMQLEAELRRVKELIEELGDSEEE